MAGALTIDTLNNSAGVFATKNAFGGIAKAWVNFNATTSGINGSMNVGSITKISTGKFTLNFSTSMQNSFYSVVAASGQTLSGLNPVSELAQPERSASNVSIVCVGLNATTATNTDPSSVSVAVFA